VRAGRRFDMRHGSPCHVPHRFPSALNPWCRRRRRSLLVPAIPSGRRRVLPAIDPQIGVHGLGVGASRTLGTAGQARRVPVVVLVPRRLLRVTSPSRPDHRGHDDNEGDERDDPPRATHELLLDRKSAAAMTTSCRSVPRDRPAQTLPPRRAGLSALPWRMRWRGQPPGEVKSSR
jgi:hypothetical protein